jgi:hypothetical protein
LGHEELAEDFSESCSMHTRGVMKGRRSICAKPLRSVGLDGGIKFFKDRDHIRGMQSSWPPVMLNCEL